MLDYGAMLLSQVKSLISPTSISDLLSPIGLGIPLIVVGHLLKGGVGVGIVFFVWMSVYLCFKDFLPF